jgi:hypothetical protein
MSLLDTLHRLLSLVAVIALAMPAIASAQIDAQSQGSGDRALFVPNAGQIVDDSLRPRPDIHFIAETEGLVLYFQSDRISYVARQVGRSVASSASRAPCPIRRVTRSGPILCGATASI